jgi:predicted amidohydrolase
VGNRHPDGGDLGRGLRRHRQSPRRRLAGGSWIVGPDGEELARTNSAHPVVAIEIDLAEADNAKLTYPRNVKDPPGSLETIP